MRFGGRNRSDRWSKQCGAGALPAPTIYDRTMEQTPTSPYDDACADYCPYFQEAVELIGRRWTGSILKVLGDRELRFGEIRSVIPGLSDRLLDARLNELHAEGIVARIDDCEGVRYKVTEKGLGLRPVFESITTWAQANGAAESADA